MSTNPELFPAIGSVVDQTQKLPVEAQTVEVTLDEERPVQEIESLCMRCEQQVCLPEISIHSTSNDLSAIGRYETALDIDSLFPGDYCHVLPMRTLWLLEQRGAVRRINTT